MARVESDPVGVTLPLFGIAEDEVVADQVIVGTIGKQNSMVTVVIGGVSTDRGIGGAVDVDAHPVEARYRTASIADLVVREGDVVRAEHVNAVVHRVCYGEAVDNDVAFARHPEGTTSGGTIASDSNTGSRRVSDRQARTSGFGDADRFGIATSQHTHDVTSDSCTGAFADGAER